MRSFESLITDMTVADPDALHHARIPLDISEGETGLHLGVYRLTDQGVDIRADKAGYQFTDVKAGGLECSNEVTGIVQRGGETTITFGESIPGSNLAIAVHAGALTLRAADNVLVAMHNRAAHPRLDGFSEHPRVPLRGVRMFLPANRSRDDSPWPKMLISINANRGVHLFNTSAALHGYDAFNSAMDGIVYTAITNEETLRQFKDQEKIIRLPRLLVNGIRSQLSLQSFEDGTHLITHRQRAARYAQEERKSLHLQKDGQVVIIPANDEPPLAPADPGYRLRVAQQAQEVQSYFEELDIIIDKIDYINFGISALRQQLAKRFPGAIKRLMRKIGN